VEKKRIKLCFAVYEQKFLFGQVLCEVRQAYMKKEAKLLFKLFSHKIYKASKIVQEIFTLDNIFDLLIKLEIALLKHSFNGYFQYNLYSLFSDPCFLFYCFVQLVRKQFNAVHNILVHDVTL
jgi:hypothetical protein